MVDFSKMSALAKKLDTVMPAITSKLESLGHVADRKAMESLYGRQIIAMAVAKGHFKSVTVIRKKIGDRTTKLSVICNEKWDRKTKPTWME